eukprot:m.479615 g.479615  ORF g.479615 m.479615 type:complete len:159 (-) comp21703_c0_seq3:2068-2544(-)
MAHLTTDPTNKARWVCIYPSYIDANKTQAQGRKLAKEHCTELPHPAFIEQVLKSKSSGLEFFIEGKAYCRDHFQKVRVRVRLFNADKSPANPSIKSRKALMEFIAKRIPQTEAYTQWKQKVKEQEQKERDEAEKEAAKEAAAAKAKPLQGKKKGKKKK